MFKITKRVIKIILVNYNYKIDEEEYDLKIAKEDFASPLIEDLNRLELFKEYIYINYI